MVIDGRERLQHVPAGIGKVGCDLARRLRNRNKQPENGSAWSFSCVLSLQRPATASLESAVAVGGANSANVRSADILSPFQSEFPFAAVWPSSIPLSSSRCTEAINYRWVRSRRLAERTHRIDRLQPSFLLLILKNTKSTVLEASYVHSCIGYKTRDEKTRFA